jgi:DNA-binding transcriptional ArsR family regulator
MIGFTPSKKTSPRLAAETIDFRRLAERIKQISDFTRLRVLLLLGDGELSVGDLSSEIACSMTSLSRHLTLLRLAGLIVFRRDGQRNIYDLTEPGWVLRKVVVGVAA